PQPCPVWTAAVPVLTPSTGCHMRLYSCLRNYYCTAVVDYRLALSVRGIVHCHTLLQLQTLSVRPYCHKYGSAVSRQHPQDFLFSSTGCRFPPACGIQHSL